MKFNNSLNSFHTDFLKSVSQRANYGQRELRDLSHKLSDLESHIRQYVDFDFGNIMALIDDLDYVWLYVFVISNPSRASTYEHPI